MLKRIISLSVEETHDFSEESKFYYPDENEDELYSLMEEILTEIFVIDEDDKDSLNNLSSNAIYDIADENEIISRERYAQEMLDEGSPSVEDFEELLSLAEEYFRFPDSHYIDEEMVDTNFVTGFVQVYSGSKFGKSGELKECWKSANCKIVIPLSDLYSPSFIVALVEENGFQWSDIVRIVFYGNPLEKLSGTRFYDKEESKELQVLSQDYPNILMAIPDYSEVESAEESIFDVIDKEFEEGIPYGIVPSGRNAIGHWMLTWSRLEELAEERLEEGNLLQLARRERSAVNKRNSFFEKFKEAKNLINGLNSGLLKVGVIYITDAHILEQVIYLSTKFNERINNSSYYLQIKSLLSKTKIQNYIKHDAHALMVIQKINNGEPVDIHLLRLVDLERIFSILWSDVGIRVDASKKDKYFQLKARLTQLRKALSSFSA